MPSAGWPAASRDDRRPGCAPSRNDPPAKRGMRSTPARVTVAHGTRLKLTGSVGREEFQYAPAEFDRLVAQRRGMKCSGYDPHLLWANRRGIDTSSVAARKHRVARVAD